MYDTLWYKLSDTNSQMIGEYGKPGTPKQPGSAGTMLFLRVQALACHEIIKTPQWNEQKLLLSCSITFI